MASSRVIFSASMSGAEEIQERKRPRVPEAADKRARRAIRLSDPYIPLDGRATLIPCVKSCSPEAHHADGYGLEGPECPLVIHTDDCFRVQHEGLVYDQNFDGFAAACNFAMMQTSRDDCCCNNTVYVSPEISEDTIWKFISNIWCTSCFQCPEYVVRLV